MKLLIVVNVDWFFCSHRLPVALGALRNGYEVHIATTFTSSSCRQALADHGFHLHELAIDRSGNSSFSFLKNYLLIYSILRSLAPDIVHLVTIQPVLLGGVAARAAGTRRVVFAISGLGHVFLANSPLARIRKWLVEKLYQFSLANKCRAVVFQNREDESKISRLCALSPAESYLIPGSGVDLSVFTCRPFQGAEPVVLMASRLLVTKGVREFVRAASILKKRGLSARFQLIGDPDLLNPAAISSDELNRWRDEGFVEILGYRSDLNKLMAQSHMVCLPSYREGLPKVLCEAAACGRVVVTTNEPGCRDAIENGVTGLLVPSRDSMALADAIEYLILNPVLMRDMGQAARNRAESFFDVNRIVSQHLDIYASLLSDS